MHKPNRETPSEYPEHENSQPYACAVAHTEMWRTRAQTS